MESNRLFTWSEQVILGPCLHLERLAFWGFTVPPTQDLHSLDMWHSRVGWKLPLELGPNYVELDPWCTKLSESVQNS